MKEISKETQEKVYAFLQENYYGKENGDYAVRVSDNYFDTFENSELNARQFRRICKAINQNPDLGFERLDNAFSESDFLKENFISLSKICREYERIIGGYYKDFTKPKGKSVPKTETDREFLLRKQYSEEYVDSLSAEELKAKAKRLRGD